MAEYITEIAQCCEVVIPLQGKIVWSEKRQFSLTSYIIKKSYSQLLGNEQIKSGMSDL